jgi:hypothetical protein
MSNVNYHVLNDSVVLNYGGRTEVISKTDNRYPKVIEAIKAGEWDKIPEIVEAIERAFEGSGLELRDGLLYDGEVGIPPELNSRILRLRDEGLPFDPLLKFWDNLKKNPSFNSRQMLFKFLEHNGHPLTPDGCFVAYRGVREDFKDKHTGTFDNSPGSVCEMPRESVDDNPNNTCSNGLHVACFDYAKGFGEKLVEVKVNPADVVCVPVDYNGTKMRTCKFEVIQECAEMRTESLYGHKPETGAEEPIYDDEDEEEKTQEELDAETLADGQCPECGDSVDSDDSFCKHCGSDLDQYRN